jgi:hypothetical protein
MKRVIIGCFVALVGVTGLSGASHAQQPATSKTKVAPTPKLDAEALRIPDSIHDTSAKKIDKTQKTLPQPSLPNKFDLGKYDLEFRAKHSGEINPRTGYDSGEKANLSNSAIGRKSDSTLPNYFGLKLSAPTN